MEKSELGRESSDEEVRKAMGPDEAGGLCSWEDFGLCSGHEPRRFLSRRTRSDLDHLVAGPFGLCAVRSLRGTLNPGVEVKGNLVGSGLWAEVGCESLFSGCGTREVDRVTPRFEPEHLEGWSRHFLKVEAMGGPRLSALCPLQALLTPDPPQPLCGQDRRE